MEGESGGDGWGSIGEASILRRNDGKETERKTKEAMD